MLRLRRLRPAHQAAVGCGLAFVVWTVAVGLGWLLGLDRLALEWAAEWRDCPTIAAAAALSIVGALEVSLLLTALGAGLCLLRRRPRAAAALFLLYISLPIELALKLGFPQSPPGGLYPFPAVCEWYHPALSAVTPHSYPSGYAIRVTYFLALLGAVLAGRAGSRGLVVALALLGLGLLASRLLVSWHWPSDLVGGALLGGALAGTTLGVASTALPPGRAPRGCASG